MLPSVVLGAIKFPAHGQSALQLCALWNKVPRQSSVKCNVLLLSADWIFHLFLIFCMQLMTSWIFIGISLLFYIWIFARFYDLCVYVLLWYCTVVLGLFSPHPGFWPVRGVWFGNLGPFPRSALFKAGIKSRSQWKTRPIAPSRTCLPCSCSGGVWGPISVFHTSPQAPCR